MEKEEKRKGDVPDVVGIDRGETGRNWQQRKSVDGMTTMVEMQFGIAAIEASWKASSSGHNDQPLANLKGA